MTHLKNILVFIFGRNWVVPLVAALGSIACSAGVMTLGRLTMSAPVEERHTLAALLGWFEAPQILMFFLLPLWLLVITVVRLIKKQFHVWRAWICSSLAGFVMLNCLANSFFHLMFSNHDDFTRGISVPEELAPGCTPPMAVPVNMHFQPPLHLGDNATLPPVVQQYADLRKTDKFMMVSGDEELPGSAPNLEKIATAAPELLHEYKLRAHCHQALSPGFQGAPHLHMLYHPAESTKRQTEAPCWNLQLPNQWQVIGGASHAHADRFALKQLKLLDEALAPLAANPTREGLDSLVPPLPEKPFIVLTETFQPGIYDLLLVAPAGYPEGSFTIKAREYTEGAELSTRMDSDQLTTKPYLHICQQAKPIEVMVYSGEWGEYYASAWELHFTPAGGGESRCVNTQLYLMQGWSR